MPKVGQANFLSWTRALERSSSFTVFVDGKIVEDDIAKRLITESLRGLANCHRFRVSTDSWIASDKGRLWFQVEGFSKVLGDPILVVLEIRTSQEIDQDKITRILEISSNHLNPDFDKEIVNNLCKLANRKTKTFWGKLITLFQNIYFKWKGNK